MFGTPCLRATRFFFYFVTFFLKENYEIEHDEGSSSSSSSSTPVLNGNGNSYPDKERLLIDVKKLSTFRKFLYAVGGM